MDGQRNIKRQKVCAGTTSSLSYKTPIDCSGQWTKGTVGKHLCLLRIGIYNLKIPLSMIAVKLTHQLQSHGFSISLLDKQYN
jgi:hypothetical protein